MGKEKLGLNPARATIGPARATIGGPGGQAGSAGAWQRRPSNLNRAQQWTNANRHPGMGFQGGNWQGGPDPSPSNWQGIPDLGGSPGSNWQGGPDPLLSGWQQPDMSSGIGSMLPGGMAWAGGGPGSAGPDWQRRIGQQRPQRPGGMMGGKWGPSRPGGNWQGRPDPRMGGLGLGAGGVRRMMDQRRNQRGMDRFNDSRYPGFDTLVGNRMNDMANRLGQQPVAPTQPGPMGPGSVEGQLPDWMADRHARMNDMAQGQLPNEQAPQVQGWRNRRADRQQRGMSPREYRQLDR